MNETAESAVPETSTAASLIVVSDFVCPWCYIGLMEVERLKQEYEIEVQFAPFYLHPETPPEGMPPRRSVPADAPPTPTELRAEPLGIKFTRGRTWSSNSYLSLQAAEFALEYGDEWVFHKRMFKAYFEDLEDIGKIENVVRIGADAGLDAASLQKCLEEGWYKERVDEGIAWSRQIGVSAVPTFVFNEKHGMVGAHELPEFRKMMEKINQPRKA